MIFLVVLYNELTCGGGVRGGQERDNLDETNTAVEDVEEHLDCLTAAKKEQTRKAEKTN